MSSKSVASTGLGSVPAVTLPSLLILAMHMRYMVLSRMHVCTHASQPARPALQAQHVLGTLVALHVICGRLPTGTPECTRLTT